MRFSKMPQHIGKIAALCIKRTKAVYREEAAPKKDSKARVAIYSVF